MRRERWGLWNKSSTSSKQEVLILKVKRGEDDGNRKTKHIVCDFRKFKIC